jgi:hypothetical protein
MFCSTCGVISSDRLARSRAASKAVRKPRYCGSVGNKVKGRVDVRARMRDDLHKGRCHTASERSVGIPIDFRRRGIGRVIIHSLLDRNADVIPPRGQFGSTPLRTPLIPGIFVLMRQLSYSSVRWFAFRLYTANRVGISEPPYLSYVEKWIFRTLFPMPRSPPTPSGCEPFDRDEQRNLILVSPVITAEFADELVLFQTCSDHEI